MSPKIRLHLVRHGETYLNRYGKMQGWSDSPLTDEGKLVATAAGQRLADTEFAYVYTSDSGRTLETAELILNESRHPVPVIHRIKAFRETFFGGFEGEYSKVALGKIAENNAGVSFAELMQTVTVAEFADMTKKADPYHHAENFEELWTRIRGGLQTVIDLNYAGDANVLIVTHGNTIRNIVNQLCEGVDVTIEIKNASVTILEHEDGKFNWIGFDQ